MSIEEFPALMPFSVESFTETIRNIIANAYRVSDEYLGLRGRPTGFLFIATKGEEG